MSFQISDVTRENKFYNCQNEKCMEIPQDVLNEIVDEFATSNDQVRDFEIK